MKAFYHFLLLSFLLFGCATKENLDPRFMLESECMVYQKDVKTESHRGFSLSYVSKDSKNQCAKQSLKHIVILKFRDKTETIIRARKPRKYIQSLRKWKQEIESDSTRIIRLEAKGADVNLTLGKIYLHSHDSLYAKQYLPYGHIHLQKRNNRWEKDSLVYNPSYPLKRPLKND